MKNHFNFNAKKGSDVNKQDLASLQPSSVTEELTSQSSSPSQSPWQAFNGNASAGEPLFPVLSSILVMGESVGDLYDIQRKIDMMRKWKQHIYYRFKESLYSPVRELKVVV